MKTGVIDYGAGNLCSVEKALKYLKADFITVTSPKEAEICDKLILPGVGAFPDAVDALKSKGLFNYLKLVACEKPLLGICLGMQLLFEKGYEFSETEGLGLIPGYVDRISFKEGCKIPHMGWNSLILNTHDSVLEGMDGRYFYFVHSYEAVTDSENVTAYTEYGSRITAAVSCGLIRGMQFHPEKSSKEGLLILERFIGEDN